LDTLFIKTENYDFQNINLVNPENPEILSNFVGVARILNKKPVSEV